MNSEEEVREFLIELNENVSALDSELVTLEEQPGSSDLVASIFRRFHTIKGTSAFFGYTTLGRVTHVTESLLDQVRSGSRGLTSDLVSLLLKATDAVRSVLVAIEADGTEGTEQFNELVQALNAMHDDGGTSSLDAAASPQAQQKNERETLPAPMPASQPAPSSSVEVPVKPAGGETKVPAPDVSEKGPSLVDTNIRVDVALLDKLMNLVGELVLARNQLLQHTAGQETILSRTAQRMNLITSELQESVMKTRMQPIGIVWNRFPRVVRDLANSFGKKITILMEGADTELDKTVLEAIKDPLMHIVRNACDHGIELPADRKSKGKSPDGFLRLRAYHEGGHVNIEITDDGAGLNVEKLKLRSIQSGLMRADQVAVMSDRDALQLIFSPGLSTAESVTAISGRGVGMDVVKTNIQKINGIVDVNRADSGIGTTVKITIPLTLAIIPCLVVRQKSSLGDKQDHRFLIPQSSLLELLRLEDHNQIEYVNGAPVVRRRGNLLPLAYLHQIFGMSSGAAAVGATNIVVLQAQGKPFGLIVEDILDTQEIVVKPMNKRLKKLGTFLGATIMGDGRIALILDVPGLAAAAGMKVSGNKEDEKSQAAGNTNSSQQTFLLFRAGAFQRLAVPLALVARLEQFSASSISSALGRPVIHYRSGILPLIDLGDALSNGAGNGEMAYAETVQVIIFGEHRPVGIIVHEIVDIVNEPITFHQGSTHPGLLGSALLGGQITDLVDLQEVVTLAGHADDPEPATRAATLLLVGATPAQRASVRALLQFHRYPIVEVVSIEDALKCLAANADIEGVIAFQDVPGLETQVRKGMRGTASMASVPVVGLCKRETSLSSAGFAALVSELDRNALLASVKQMLGSGARKGLAA